MLKTIEIKNYLLIESIKVDFDNNFNIITGETGSGKSILIGALNLLAGSRVDHKVVGTSNKKCKCIQLICHFLFVFPMSAFLSG